MRIDQMLPSFGKYDAIGNDVRLLRTLLRKEGFQSDIFTDQGHIEGDTKPYRGYACHGNRGNILIHHYSIGSDLPYFLTGIGSFKVTRYHNITPYHYFPYTSLLEAYFRCREGRCQLPLVKSISDTFWTTSLYNANELETYQFKQGYVLPVLRRYDELSKGNGCPKTAKMLRADQKKNMLFVGRVMPHKAHHDLIFLLKQYKTFVGPNLRLILVGGGEPHYVNKLLFDLASDLDLKVCTQPRSKKEFLASDIIFAGTTTEKELTSYYRHSDVFVSLSEHEGFCVPLVEAMFFGIPILAHKAAAVPETSGTGALMIDKSDPVATLEGLARILNDPESAEYYRSRSFERSQAFTWEELQVKFKKGLKAILHQHAEWLAKQETTA